MKNMDDGPKPSGITPEQLDRVVEILRENEQLKLQVRQKQLEAEEIFQESHAGQREIVRLKEELMAAKSDIEKLRALGQSFAEAQTKAGIERNAALLQVRDCMEVVKALRFACNEGGPMDLMKNLDKASAMANKVFEKYAEKAKGEATGARILLDGSLVLTVCPWCGALFGCDGKTCVRK